MSDKVYGFDGGQGDFSSPGFFWQTENLEAAKGCIRDLRAKGIDARCNQIFSDGEGPDVYEIFIYPAPVAQNAYLMCVEDFDFRAWQEDRISDCCGDRAHLDRMMFSPVAWMELN